MIDIFQNIENALFGGVGNMYLVALGIMVFFLIVMMVVGLDFRFALLIDTPLTLVFADVGWFPKWVGGIFWVVVIGISIFIFWNFVKER